MVTVIVPWRGGCPHREAAWNWVADRYQETLPDWHVFRCDAAPGPWRKGTAVNLAVKLAQTELIILTDADVWCAAIPAAVQQVRDGAAWAIPHNLVHRLTANCTRQLLAGQDPVIETDEPIYRGLEGGGIVVTTRDVLLDVPVDERFAGWGQEDMSHGAALHTLYGPPIRGTADLIHLWHPPQQRLTRKVGNPKGHHLQRRYLSARNDPDMMRAVIEEGRCSPTY